VKEVEKLKGGREGGRGKVEEETRKTTEAHEKVVNMLFARIQYGVVFCGSYILALIELAILR